ncbi:uncharacterized protein PHACADRAFT_254669 [Phanerochaete carnosa HHB-10118-sp]|uniref:Uncharacterized protein n=1 Tax=Phanerochaete carnosa (strain HHB-10118-sp) TaxID=650164 RepID=K5V3F3_PHACS|nr:uncharacterized protein PHACADRAFT_254669 [Phanerochaete carnosa HHB-10118-sp]EKM57106.1 hypothetical protein PHACADRAFT_254669 [Phanerochaete carnosa HHB-10118-sp]
MAASTSSMRQVLVASQRALGRGVSVHAVRRRSMSTAAMALPLEEPSTIDLPIFDIFDAPSRLGESSKMLAEAARSRPERVASRAVERDGPARATVKSLPPPTIYDGPARPRGLALGPRVRGMHSRAMHTSEARELPSALPPPELFDGPSRLRPYTRDRISSDDSVSFATLLVGAAAAGTLAYTAWSKVEERAEQVKRQRAERRATYRQAHFS